VTILRLPPMPADVVKLGSVYELSMDRSAIADVGTLDKPDDGKVVRVRLLGTVHHFTPAQATRLAALLIVASNR